MSIVPKQTFSLAARSYKEKEIRIPYSIPACLFQCLQFLSRVGGSELWKSKAGKMGMEIDLADICKCPYRACVMI